jgi:hypothetical protein
MAALRISHTGMGESRMMHSELKNVLKLEFQIVRNILSSESVSILRLIYEYSIFKCKMTGL